MIQLSLFIIIALGLLRYLTSARTGKPSKHLLVSCFTQTIPFGYGLMLYQLDDKMIGALGNGVRLEIPAVFALLLFGLNFKTIKKRTLSPAENKWFLVFIAFGIISLLNPVNKLPLAVIVPVAFLIQIFLLLVMIESNFTRLEIFRGVYDGLKIVTIVQFVLCICYPLLNLEQFITLFHGTGGAQWAERREGYKSAIGTFSHPAHLALFSLISSIFYMAAYFNNYRKKQTVYILIFNLIVIYFTYSRTTLIALFVVFILLQLSFKGGTGIFTLKNILRFLLIFSFLIFILYLTPLSELFLKSDSDTQFKNRFLHWILGYEIWEKSKYIGVGLNSHVYYMGNNYLEDPSNGAIELEFFTGNPIHNIHVIVFAELGIVGILVWMYFFLSSINKYSKNNKTRDPVANIFNLTYYGTLVTIFLYGFFGWAPFEVPIYSLVLFLGYFAHKTKKKSVTSSQHSVASITRLTR